MGLTRLSVFHPVVALTAYLALVIFGVMSYVGLGLEKSPQLNLPIVTVQVVFPGASAQTVEEQVTREIEDAVAGLGDIKKLSSISRPGRSSVTVEFQEGIDVDVAAADVQQRVSGVERGLPAEAEKPSYLKLDLNDVPMLYLAVTGPPGADEMQLYRVADDVVRPRLETAPDVGRVVVAGGREPEVQIELLPDRLRAYGLAIGDVTAAVRAQFLTASGGEVKSGEGGGTRQTSLSVNTRQPDLAALGALPVTGADGFRTELRNVANVSLAGAEPDEVLRVSGSPAAGLLVYKQASANVATTVDALLPLVERLDAELPPGYRLDVAIDTSTSVRQTVKGVEHELQLAIVITGIVLFFFLHSLRPTIIVLLAIPTSLLAAMVVMKLLGLTLNTMTLIGLTTAIGVLVDDSIVVLENIHTHLEHGKEAKQAAIDGRSEIGLAAMAITLVDVAVWGPILLMTGLTGAFLKNFAIVMVAATLASLLISFTLTPLVASRWLAAGKDRSWLARLTSFWEPLYGATERGYGHALRWSLRHRPVILLLALLVFSSNLLLLPRIGTEYVPETNDDTAIIIGQLPAGTALEGANRAAKAWEMLLLDRERFPEIHTAYVLVGRGETDSDREPRFISVTLDLGEPKSRARTSKEIGKAAAKMGEAVVPGLQTYLGGARGGGQGQPVQVRVFGDDLAELDRLARTVETTLAAQPELTDVQNSLAFSPELVIEPDARRLLDFGLTARQVGDAVRVAYQGGVVGQWPDPNGRERDVRVRLPDSLRYDPTAVADLPLVRRGPQMLTIRQVAAETSVVRPGKIERLNRQRFALIGAEPNGVPLGSATGAVTRAMSGVELPDGSHWAFAGQGEDQQSSFSQLAFGLGVSVLLMYMVLAILYENWLQPLLIQTALPLASVGAFAGLLLFGRNLSLPAFIGLIALFGLVGKNSILLVDRANDLRLQGLDRTAALEQAGPSRLRPILMTSSVLILSMLPVAMQLGEGGEVRAPLGAVLVGGMTTSSFLALLYVPVAYTYFDSAGTLFGRLLRWRPGRAHDSMVVQPEVAQPKLVPAADASSPGASPDLRRAPPNEPARPSVPLDSAAGQIIARIYRAESARQDLVGRVLQTADAVGTRILDQEGVLAVLPKLSPEDRELLRPLATSVATELLRERLTLIEARIREREAYLDEIYPDGRPCQTGEEDVTEVYRQEQRILEELLVKVQTQIFVDLLHQRLARAQQRVRDFSGSAEPPIRSAADRRRRLAAWTEERILADLARQWITWLKKRNAPESPQPGLAESAVSP